MWEEWRAHIDKTVRDAERGRISRERTEQAYRDFRITTLSRAGGQTPRDLPKHWHLGVSAAKARPIL